YSSSIEILFCYYIKIFFVALQFDYKCMYSALDKDFIKFSGEFYGCLNNNFSVSGRKVLEENI
ncbi:hypothetical protein ACFVM9_13440, partial [Bacillus mobilis]|uniref:hypothetical protein n=1 Tax=Bacillus mobilis TaxID=2026190 RepID=UPI00366B8AD3